MTLDVWNKCRGENHIKDIHETAWRMELQEQTSTRKLVDSLEEQKVLDEIIEESKPALSILQKKFHPLLSERFRYPPLKHGSRFGKRTEPSLWYGSFNIETAMAEMAFLRFTFIRASDEDFGMVTAPMTTFSIKLKMNKGVSLNEEPFIQYQKHISSPTSYEVSQLLGARMRANDLDGFTYFSARDKKKGINAGLFKITSFASKHPDAESFQTWQCNTTKTSVEFTQVGSIHDRTLIFPIKEFQINGKLPFPAM